MKLSQYYNAVEHAINWLDQHEGVRLMLDGEERPQSGTFRIDNSANSDVDDSREQARALANLLHRHLTPEAQRWVRVEVVGEATKHNPHYEDSEPDFTVSEQRYLIRVMCLR